VKRKLLVALLVLALGGLAFFVRFWRLEEVPPGFYMDEASVGVEAWHIATEGKDSRGEPWPVVFRALEDWKHPIGIYAVALSERVLGPTRLAVRLPFAVMGTLTVLLLGLLVLELNGDPRAAVLATLVLAVTPWHVHYSRVWEVTTLDFTAVLALWLYLRARRRKKAHAFIIAGGAFALVLYSYVASKLLVPGLLLVILVAELRERSAARRLEKRLQEEAAKAPKPIVDLGLDVPPEVPPPVSTRNALLFLVALVVVALPMVVAQLRHWDEIQTRFRAVSVFREASPLLAMGRAYAAHLDPAFLFVKGDANPRHGPPGWGLLLLATSPFVAIALLKSLARGELDDFLLLGWLLVYPLGACLTSEGIPHATRSFLAVPLFAILAARGVTAVMDRLEVPSTRVGLFLVSAVLFLGNGAWVLEDYFTTYAQKTGLRWTAGVERLVPGLLTLRPGIKRIHFMRPPFGDIGIIREHVLFLTKFDPAVDLDWFDFDDSEKGGWFLAHLPKDEAVVAWRVQHVGLPPILKVEDGTGEVAFEVFRGLGAR